MSWQRASWQIDKYMAMSHVFRYMDCPPRGAILGHSLQILWDATDGKRDFTENRQKWISVKAPLMHY